jgi:hypothetical protein
MPANAFSIASSRRKARLVPELRTLPDILYRWRDRAGKDIIRMSEKGAALIEARGSDISEEAPRLRL